MRFLIYWGIFGTSCVRFCKHNKRALNMAKRFPWIIVLILLIPYGLLGQDSESVRKDVEQVSTCEHLKRTLDYSYLENQKLEDAYVFMLFRAGNLEKSNEALELRMKMLEDYYSRFRKPNRYIMAIGNRTDGLGLVEFYIGGKLYEIIAFGHNGLMDCEH